MKNILSILFILYGQSLVAVVPDNHNLLTIEKLAPLYASKLVDSIASNKIRPNNKKRFRTPPINHYDFVEEFKIEGEKIQLKQREHGPFDSIHLKN